jgi:hypothetical protein
VVVKYADNVLKVFASSFSILLSCIISAVLFDFRPNVLFSIGACLVILSTVMYSKPSSGGNSSINNHPWGSGRFSVQRKTSLVM